MTSPTKAFVLGAGLGTRMRPLTDARPKPLIEIAGRSLLDRALDGLATAGVTETIINTHYLAAQIEQATKNRVMPSIRLSHEPNLLDTGGGIKKALHYFGSESFYVLSGDGLWTDGPVNALERLAQAWDPARMDILILLQPLQTFKLTQGVGDYDLLRNGKAVRSRSKNGGYMFTSMRINHPGIFENTPEGPFSYLTLLDAAEQKGRLYGMVHDAQWHHLSTPEDVEAVNRSIAGGIP